MNERKLGIQNTITERERVKEKERGKRERKRKREQQPVVLLNQKEMTNNKRPLPNKYQR